MFSLLQAGLPGMERDALAIAADVSLIAIGVFAVIGSIIGIWLMRRVGILTYRLGQMSHRLAGQSNPLLEHGRGIAANLEFISAALRTDVQSLSNSVQALSDRLQQASDRMEERIEEFNALMEVVQGEAEEMFLDTASTVRGVKASAAELVSGGSRARRTPSTDLTSPSVSSMTGGTADEYTPDEESGIDTADAVAGDDSPGPRGRN